MKSIRIIVLLVTVIALSALLAVSAFAAENEESATVSVSAADSILQSGGIPEKAFARYDEASLEETTRDDVLYKIILDGLRGVSDSISLSGVTDAGFEAYSYKNAGDTEAFNAVFSSVINRNPELFYVDNGYRISYSPSSGAITAMLPTYIYSGTELESVRAEYESLLDEVCAIVPENASDYETLLLLNGYLASNYCYDERVYDSATAADANFDAYSFLKEKTAVCQGYTLAMIALADRFGIQCDAATSPAMNHTWNYVNLNGNWYHLDVTHNDPTPDIPGRVMYRKFLRSDDGMTALGASGWTALYDCTDTSYDAAASGLSITAPIVNYGGAWYTTEYYNYSARLYKLDTADVRELYEKVSGGEIGTQAYNMGHWAAASGGLYASAFSYPLVYGDYLIFNAPNAVCVYDGNTVVKAKEYTLAAGTNIYGFNADGDTLVLLFADSPNLAATSEEKISLETYSYNDYDGTNLGSVLYGNGEAFTEVPNDPVRESDENYSYTFAGWTKSGNTFTAAYDRKPLGDFVVIDGVLVESAVESGVVRVPSGVEKIAKDAFANTPDIESVVLPESVTALESGAFGGTSCTVYLTFDSETIEAVLKADGVEFRLMGDIDADGSVTFADLTALAKNLAKSSNFTDIVCADLNADGKVTLADLSALAAYFFAAA